MYQKFLACTSKLRTLAKDVPDMQLLKRNIPVVAHSAPPEEDSTAPDLTNLDFHKRALIEGLLGNGILRRTDVPGLLTSLKQHAPAELLSRRVLESLFTEERIRHAHSVVACESDCGGADNRSSFGTPPNRATQAHSAPGHDPHGASHADTSARWSSSA